MLIRAGSQWSGSRCSEVGLARKRPPPVAGVARAVPAHQPVQHLDQPPVVSVAELKPYAGPHTPIIDKYIYTLFTPEGTRLVAERGWTDLYVCGIDTDICVLKTAVDAFEQNLTPWILKDACASHSGPEAHTAGLFIAERFIWCEPSNPNHQPPRLRFATAA